MFYIKKMNTKNIFILFLVTAFLLTPFLSIIDAQGPEFNVHPNDHETLRLKNRTQNTPTWRDPISANPGDRVSFDVYYHNNTEDTTAKNTTVRIDYPCTVRSQIVSTAYISADNASTVSGTGTINVTGDPQKLIFDNTALWYPNRTTNPTTISVKQVGPCSVEVDIGDIKGCWPYQGHVVFSAKLTDYSDDPEGSLRCHSSTEDSIRISYDFYDGSNVSLFRGNTRLTILGSGDRAGTYNDTGLSSNRSYTYYLRNGTSSSSPLLASVTCSTEREDEVWGELSCYSSTDNSIRLSYDFYGGSNVSLFRGSTRIETWTQSSRSGRITDTGLSADRSYTYYLRNGRFTSSTLLDRVVCRTSDDDKEESLSITKRVKSVERDTVYYNSLGVSPGELVNYSIRVTANDALAKDVVVKDSLPARVNYVGNLRVDGTRVSGDIEKGLNIGDIEEGEHKEVTFDARIAGRDHFLIGITSITNVARVTSKNDTETDTATVRVTRERITVTPTEIPTGITGNTFMDYVALPFIFTILLFIIFKRHFLALVRKIEGARKEVREEW
jgi:hypothetical protein